jgi:ABC-type Na+ transport system ATPase subunit NatA
MGAARRPRVRAIAGLLDPSGGVVRVCGWDPHREPEAEARTGGVVMADSPSDARAQGCTHERFRDLSQLEFIDCAGADAVLEAVAESRHSAGGVQVEPNMAEQGSRLFDY